MGIVWFCLVAVVLAGYVVLDGFDIGVGILHRWIACNDAERRTVIRSIGPVWNGNEVWLLAGGGTLYFAFPALYAESFSGFYLPLIMVLWLLIIRGASVEFRDHIAGGIWAAFWDAGFTLASVLLAIFYGAALGNVVRGVPFDSAGHFFEPLWTTFNPVGQTGILDWYTVLIGVAALAALTMHGATWLVYKTEGELNLRARQWAARAWWPVAVLTLAITVISFRLLPRLSWGFREKPWGLIFPFLAVLGLLAIPWLSRAGREAMTFGASCLYLIGMLTSVAFSLFPSVLPSSTNPNYGLTIANSKAADYGLKIGLTWWALGMLLASGYTIYNYRSFAGKIRTEEPNGPAGKSLIDSRPA
jgi:cytochrome d ubiquinol oxidase subunit II